MIVCTCYIYCLLLPFSSFYNYPKKIEYSYFYEQRYEYHIHQNFMAKHAINAKYYICGLIIYLLTSVSQFMYMWGVWVIVLYFDRVNEIIATWEEFLFYDVRGHSYQIRKKYLIVFYAWLIVLVWVSAAIATRRGVRAICNQFYQLALELE